MCIFVLNNVLIFVFWCELFLFWRLWNMKCYDEV